MPSDQLLALLALAFAGSFTPGPNNTIATLTGANYGWRAAVPHMLGVPLGFASMLLAATGGVAAVVLASAEVALLLKVAGTLYLLWLAWLLARAGSTLGDAVPGPFRLPLSLPQSALFQYLNPKAWTLAAATAGMFVNTERPFAHAALIVIVFSIAAFSSLVVWAWAGASLRAWLAHGRRLQHFNRLMAALLAATAFWMLLR